MKTSTQNAGRRELLPGAKRPRKSNGAAIFNIDSFHYKKQTIKRRRSEVMKKRLVAFLLVLIMVLGMLPVSAFAADDGVSPQALESNETQTIKYQILYVGDEFNTGYNYGVSVNKTYTCQYSTGHSGFNHSILISEFRNVGVPALKGQLDSGYEFVG